MVGKRRSVRETGLGFKIDMDVQNLHVGSDRWSKDSKGTSTYNTTTTTQCMRTSTRSPLLFFWRHGRAKYMSIEAFLGHERVVWPKVGLGSIAKPGAVVILVSLFQQRSTEATGVTKERVAEVMMNGGEIVCLELYLFLCSYYIFLIVVWTNWLQALLAYFDHDFD